MRKVIADAEVGDDVYHDDPLVLALEERVAGLLGQEDAMYVPTGTMSNQVALHLHTSPGDVVLAAASAHINNSELGAPAVLSGIRVIEVPSDRGRFAADSILAALPVQGLMPSSLFEPFTLVALENTHNGGGGAVWPLEQMESVTATARRLGMAAHLDGARLWNASAFSGVSVADYAASFDTTSVCFSKGLGAPMGSALVGSAGLIKKARRFKQMFGGGFRQAGMMAAGALYAVDNHRDRLVEDHENAARLAVGLADIPNVDIDPAKVETNLVYFQTDGAVRICAELAEEGVYVLPAAENRIRAVTHIGIDSADIDKALGILHKVVG